MEHGPSVAVFLSQIVVLLIVGRIAGELMQRIGQPPVMGQLIAGMLLGPSVLGALCPDLQHAAVSRQLPARRPCSMRWRSSASCCCCCSTGMETDLSVFRDARRPAFSISLAGIVVPFACGIALGALLPDSHAARCRPSG